MLRIDQTDAHQMSYILIRYLERYPRRKDLQQSSDTPSDARPEVTQPISKISPHFL